MRGGRDRPAGARLAERGLIDTLYAFATDPATIAERAASVVLGGGTLVFPTDTVYGIGCDPLRRASIAQIYALKGRDERKPLSLHVASVDEALEYIGTDAVAADAVRKLLPGAVTLIVRRPAFIDEHMTSGLETMGLRVPDHALCLTILERCGPLAATSANRSGAPAFEGSGTRAVLPAADLLIDAGPTPRRGESTIVDLTAGRPRLVREGVVSVTELERALGRIERPS